MEGPITPGFGNIDGRIPGREVLPSETPKKFLVFSLFLFIVTILLYLGLSVGYKAFLNKQIEDLDMAVEDLRFEVSEEEQEELLNFFSQVSNMQVALDGHVMSSRTFPFIEENTHGRVAYRSMDLSTVEGKIILDGVAADYDALVAQLSIFETVDEVEKIILDSSQRSGGAVNFRVTLVVDKELFDFEPSVVVREQTPTTTTTSTAR